MLSYVDKERSLSCMLYVEEKFFHCKMFFFSKFMMLSYADKEIKKKTHTHKK